MGRRTCDNGVTSFYILLQFPQLWKESKSGIHDPSTYERECDLHVSYNSVSIRMLSPKAKMPQYEDSDGNESAKTTTWHIVMHLWLRWRQSKSRKLSPKPLRTHDGSKRWMRRCKHSPRTRPTMSSPLHTNKRKSDAVDIQSEAQRRWHRQSV